MYHGITYAESSSHAAMQPVTRSLSSRSPHATQITANPMHSNASCVTAPSPALEIRGARTGSKFQMDVRVTNPKSAERIDPNKPGTNKMTGTTITRIEAPRRHARRRPRRAAHSVSGKSASPAVILMSIAAASTKPAEANRFRSAASTATSKNNPTNASLWPPFTMVPATTGCSPTSTIAALLRHDRHSTTSATAIAAPAAA